LRTRLLASVVIGAAVAAAGVLVSSGPAAAATPTCSDAKVINNLYVPVSSSGSRTCTLRRGNTGPGVTVLQEAMKNCYYPVLRSQGMPYTETDGNFGPKTFLGLEYVQDDHEITVDGIYGPQTASTMYFAAKNASYCGRP
jgi:peptidoglycan hydrolase-like protein with peptidoglycan-binding domain